MESTIAIAAVVQAATAVVIAIMTIIYTKVTARMFQASIDPCVKVDISGYMGHASVDVENDSGCSVSDLSVYVSIGYTRNGAEYPVRRCILARTWPVLQAGARVKADSSPDDPATRKDADTDLPEGVKVNPNDLLVEYSFVRAADRRRYCLRYQVGFLCQADGRKSYMRIGEPQSVSDHKTIVVQRVNESKPKTSGAVKDDVIL